MFQLVLKCPAIEFRGRLSTTFNTPYHLKGKWEVAVTNLRIYKSVDVILCCDLVDYTHVGDNRMRFLQFYDAETSTNPKPTYVSVAKKRFDSINVDLMRSPDFTNPYPESFSDVICVLHFRKS
jgi:hypothetical protein